MRRTFAEVSIAGRGNQPDERIVLTLLLLRSCAPAGKRDIGTMGRTARILSWSAGIFVALIVVAVGAGYLFLTSDDFRSRVESSASAYSGRKTHIAKITIDWGSTAHVHLDGVEVANAAVGQGRPHAEGRAGRFRHQAVAAAQGRYRPVEPGAAQARGRRRSGRQGAVELEPRRKPGNNRPRQGGGAQGTDRDAADRSSRDHRRAALLPGHQAQALARRHGLDGGRQGRRPAAGRAAAQGQDREPAAHGPLHRRLGPDAARHRSSPIRSISMSTTAPRNSP